METGLISNIRTKGFSLVELLVAMVLSIVLLAGVIELYLNSKQTYNMQEGLSRLQENSRFAVDRLYKAISAGGFLGCLSSDGAVVNTLTDQSGSYNFSSPVTGTDNSGVLGTDTLIISRAVPGLAVPVISLMNDQTSVLRVDNANANFSELKQFDVVTVSDCARAATFMITNSLAAAPGNAGEIQHDTGVVATSGGNLGQSNSTTDLETMFGANNASQAVIMPIQRTSYSIRNSAAGACTAATPGFCALFENDNELVEGVQDFQVLYGEDAGTDGEADVYRIAPNVIDWNRVVSIRVSLSVNTVERVQGQANGIVSPDSTRTYTSTIRLRSRGA